MKLVVLLFSFVTLSTHAVTLEERFQGSILGVYLGDSLGKGCEVIYKDHPELAPQSYQDRNITEFAPREDKLEGGFYEGRDKHQVRGTYTDDTEEMLAVLRSLISVGQFDSEKSSREIAKSYRPAHGYSKSTGLLFKAIQTADSAQTVIQVRNQFNLANDPTRAYRDSNGCAMRIASIALLYQDMSEDELRDMIYQSCDPTHPALAPKEGATLIALGIKWALKQNSFDGQKFIQYIESAVASYRKRLNTDNKPALEPTLLEAVSVATNKTKDQIYADNLKDLETLLSNVEKIPELLAKNMSVAEETEYLRTNFKVTYETAGSIPTTLYLVARYGSDLRTTMNATAQVALAGDTDTIPAMAGSILGAIYGPAMIPADWLKQLYRDDASWKTEAGYRDDYHEDFTPGANGAIYYSWQTAKEMASKLAEMFARD